MSISIDNGRQLFVDDYLIQSISGIVRHWNSPVKSEVPVLRPTKVGGFRSSGCTVATDGGLWWDPVISKFRLWYEENWTGNLCYAESTDGHNWHLPDLGIIPGTNRLFTDEEEISGKSVDSWSVLPDYTSEAPYSNWKMLVSPPGGMTDDILFESADGKHWTRLGSAGKSGDRSTMHYDAILGKWVFSLRSYRNGKRSRDFFAVENFSDAIRSQYENPGEWPGVMHGLEAQALHLYNFDAVPYESLMLGVMEILHKSPRDNIDCIESGLPKQTELRFAFSRDGKDYSPAPCAALSPSGLGSGKWDTGYLSATGGICVILEERLCFFYSALRGDAEMRREVVGDQPLGSQGMYYNGAIGMAMLRRDGFAGMVADGNGEIVTKPLSFTGGHLFVNAECLFGELSAEIIDENGLPFTGFSADDCRQMKFDDSTKYELVFSGGSLSSLSGKGARIRFRLHCATLYSFWISPSARGESGGYIAAGGPDYTGLKDLPCGTGSVCRPSGYHRRECRGHVGIPSIAVSPVNGRMWATWYCGKSKGEDLYNYVVLATSIDGGNSWREVLVADPDNEGPKRAFDPELWISPDGLLRWTWTERMTDRAKCDFSKDYGGDMGDPASDELMMVTLSAEDEPALPVEHVRIGRGVMMCKPIVVSSGEWLFPVAHWGEAPSACFYVSSDGGKSFSYRGGVTIPEAQRLFDEHQTVELSNGDILVCIRAGWGADCHPWMAISHDKGATWEEPFAATFSHTSSRVFFTRLKSGNLLLVKHGPPDKDVGRKELMAFISRDEGKTWEGGLMIDSRAGVSYPDGIQREDGTIVVIYDYHRLTDKEIFVAEFTEDDIIARRDFTGKARSLRFPEA